jgi:hypothetical protein
LVGALNHRDEVASIGRHLEPRERFGELGVFQCRLNQCGAPIATPGKIAAIHEDFGLCLATAFVLLVTAQAMKRTRRQTGRRKGKDEGLAIGAPAQEEEEGCPTTTTTCWTPEVPPNPLTQHYATRNPQYAQPVLSVVVPLWFTPGTHFQAPHFLITILF